MIQKRQKRFLYPGIVVIALSLLSSCISNKKVVLLQNDEVGYANDSLLLTIYEQYKLQYGDNLRVDIRSSDPTLTDIFSASSSGGNSQMGGAGGDVNYLMGYPVNPNGDIELPIIGFIHVQGKTLNETKQIIEKNLHSFIKDGYVSVKLSGIRFSALGEFNGSGQKNILQSRVTILEAIAAAGDLSVLADRKNLLLIRQFPTGIKTFTIDLTDRNLLTSPYYYMQPGDQLYAPPLKVRQFGTGITGVQTLTTLMSVVSTALVLFLTLNKL